jgi:alkanesulfonate monooxygenase SsuD/methylene tetrahydromethanopterin reductase-like flavin-dependent oxidoreductase (luciferase family)
MRRLLAEAGRPPGSFALSKRVYLATGPKPEAALDGIRRWIGAFYGDAGLADRWAIWGTPEECVEKLGPLLEAGLDHVLLNPVADELEQVEIIAADIAPKL